MLVTQQKNRTDDLCLSVFLDTITPTILNQGLFCFFFKKAHVKTGHTGYIYRGEDKGQTARAKAEFGQPEIRGHGKGQGARARRQTAREKRQGARAT